MNVLELTATGEGGFLGTVSATCHYTQEADTSSGCTITSAGARGVMATAICFREGSAVDSSAALFGTGQLIGGTGKFAGAIGVLSFSYGESGRQRGFYSLPIR